MATPAQKLQAERLSFPGMLPREIIVFREWLRQHEKEFDRFDYNVRIGDGQDPGPSFPPEIRKMAQDNSKKRLDAVGWQGRRATIIEVKDRAGASAIGQLVTYDALWRRERPAEPAPALLLVANRIAPDVLPVLARAGIQLAIVEVDFRELRPENKSST